MIEVSHLTKRYGANTAVSDLCFSVDEGQVYGFLGPNGAGKSTTMNIMTGCLAATEGEVTVDGHDIFEEARAAKKCIGYLPENPPLYVDRTPLEYLAFVGRAKGVPKDQIGRQVERAMKATDIADVSGRLIKNLSKGYKQRVGIAQAILGDPKVIILDEPTIGLDPKQIIEIRELITSLGKKHTVILSSHILSEVQAVCNTILIISKGKLVANGTPEELEKLFGETATLRLTVETEPKEAEEIVRKAGTFLSVEAWDCENSRSDLVIETDRDDSVLRDLFFAFAEAGKPILRMDSARSSLEDIFLELTSAEAAAKAEQDAEEDAEAMQDADSEGQWQSMDLLKGGDEK
jgi:ABC-2 type transport system ATP-binding protein